MNKTYRLAWNELTHSWVAVAEIVKARGKRSTRALLRAVLLVTALAAVLPAPTFAQTAPPSTALPSGGQVVAGSASIAQSGATMNITQSTQRAAIDWQTFNVGSSATVNFIQPSSSAVILNRVLAANPSQIFGQINSNGQVFLTNPSGVYFAPGSSVNVGALVATTHGIGNADFMAGKHKFTRNGATGSVINEGDLSAGLGGYIALLAPEVRNNGAIIAQAGTVALAAGEAFELQFSNGSLVNVQVEPAAIKALVDNGQAVQAPGGLIILSARAADQLQGGVVRNSGSLEASSLVEHGGVIRLEGDHLTLGVGSSLTATGATGGGEVSVGGQWQGSGSMHQATSVTMESGSRIDVSATKVGAGGTAVLWSDITRSSSQTLVNGQISAKGGAQGGDGGRIETSGAFVSIGGDTRVDTLAPQGRAGIWLIDPINFTVSAGGAAQTTSGIGATTLSTNLNTGSVTIQTQSTGAESGDITVSSAVTKASGTRTTLTLAADRHVIVSAPISGTAGSPLNVVLAARARGGATGVVDVKRDIRTFGGDITIGGGDLQASGYAIATAGYYDNNAGVYVGSTSQNNSTSAMLDATGDGSGVADTNMPTAATGGNIIIRGSGSSTSEQSNLGVLIAQGTGSVGSVITGGTGSISIDGKGGNGRAFFAIGSTGILLGLNANIKANLGNITLKGTAGTGSDRYGIAADGNKLIGTRNGYVNIEGDSMLIRNGTVTINAGANSDIKAPIVGCDGGAVVSCLAYGLTKTGTGILNLSADAEAWNNARPTNTRATPTNGTFTDTSVNVISPVTANGALYAFGVRPTVNIVTVATSTPRLDITLLQSKSKTYGAANPSLVKDTDYTLSGCVTCPTLDWGSAMTLTTSAGSYGYGTGTTQTTANLFSLTGSYTLTWNYGTGLSMTVNKAPLTVTANNASKTYNGQAYSGGNGVTYSGFVNSQTSAVLGGTLAYGGNSQAAVNTGSYAITPSGLTAANYDFSFVNGTLTVTKAPLTVTADAKTRTYGAANPALTASITGFVNGEDLASSGVAGAVGLTTAATTGTGVGTASIVAALGTLVAANYDFSFVNGTLTVTKAPLTVTADAKTRTYGAANPALTASITGFVNGEDLASSGVAGEAGLSTTAMADTPVGTAEIVAAIGTLVAANYDFSFTNGTLTISPAPEPAPEPPPPPPAPPPLLPAPTTAPQPLVPTFGDMGSAGLGSPLVATSGGVSVSLVREPSLQEAGIIAVSVPKEMATAGAGFTFPLPAQVAETATNRTISVSLANGNPLPGFLRFNAETKTFVATSVPDGAFPLQVVVTIGATSTTIVISERAE